MFYFSRRHQFDNAEDLAQETLAAVLTRDDFEFEKEEDFLKVCYGFAGRISQAGYRQTQKHAASELDPNAHPSGARTCRLDPAEAAVLLDEVIRTAELHLKADDWRLIQQAMSTDRGTIANQLNLGDANNVRVRLYRARPQTCKANRLAERITTPSVMRNEQYA